MYVEYCLVLYYTYIMLYRQFYFLSIFNEKSCNLAAFYIKFQHVDLLTFLGVDWRLLRITYDLRLTYKHSKLRISNKYTAWSRDGFQKQSMRIKYCHCVKWPVYMAEKGSSWSVPFWWARLKCAMSYQSMCMLQKQSEPQFTTSFNKHM